MTDNLYMITVTCIFRFFFVNTTKVAVAPCRHDR